MNIEEYNELVSSGVVLVDFYTDYCPPCKMLSPILDQLQGVNIVKVNAADSQELSLEHKIQNVPTLKFYKDGECVETLLGFKDKEFLQNKINQLLEG